MVRNNGVIGGGNTPNKKIILKEARDNTFQNYSFESTDHQIDNLDEKQITMMLI